MIKAYVEYWKRYVDFSGKTTVGGYWWTVLVNIIISAIFSALALIPGVGFISYIYSLATLIPGIAIVVRRLRDAGYKWYNIFWLLLPLVGWIILIIRLIKPSK